VVDESSKRLITGHIILVGITAALAVLKLCVPTETLSGYIPNLSWWIVFAPIWSMPVLAAIAGFVCFVWWLVDFLRRKV
jgi:hypothetical protein